MKKVSLMALMLVAGANVNAANYYVGGKIGYTNLQTITYENDKVKDKTDFKGHAFDYSVNVGVKADDVRFDVEADTMTFAELQKDKATSKMTSLMSNVYYDVDLQKLAGVSAPVKPYVSAGLGFTHIDQQKYEGGKYVAEKLAAYSKQATWSVGAGIAYEVMPMVTVDAGYKYQRLFAANTNEGKDFTKDTKHSVMFGARYGF